MCVCVCVCAFGMVLVVAYMFTCAWADLCIFGSQRRSSPCALVVHRKSMTVHSSCETASLQKYLQRANRPTLAAIFAEGAIALSVTLRGGELFAN